MRRLSGFFLTVLLIGLVLSQPAPGQVKTDGRFIKWTEVLPLPTGLYQVRVSVRDRKTGHTGSAMTWIEIR